MKQTWSIIDETQHRKKKKSLPRVFSHNGRLLKEPVEIANAFNRCFIDIRPFLANQIHTHHNYKEYLRNPSKNQIALQPIEEYKVIQVIDRLKNKSSKGIDGISTNLIKTAKYVFAKPLTLNINQMLYSRIFPKQLNVSKVIPLHKANDKLLLKNYRPISLLPFISKIFEYILLEQLTNHFIENKLLSLQQYGFCAKDSTEVAALNLVNHLTYKLDNGIIPINIYIDLSKAFDTLIHHILLDKLSCYGINSVAKTYYKAIYLIGIKL